MRVVLLFQHMLVVTTASSSSGRGHPVPHPSVSRHAGGYPAHPPGAEAPRGAHGLHPGAPMHRLPHPNAAAGHYPPGAGGSGPDNGGIGSRNSLGGGITC